MFDAEFDIKLIISTITGVIVLGTTAMALIGFSIKKLLHIMKG